MVTSLSISRRSSAQLGNSAAESKVGLFGVGLDTYWPQFPGLEERLQGRLGRVAEQLSIPGVKVVNLGLIDTPEKASAAGHTFRQADVDLIFLYVTTYALSSTVLPVVRRAKVSVIILNLSPEPALEYERFNKSVDRQSMTGNWLAVDGQDVVPLGAGLMGGSLARLPWGRTVL